MDEAAERRFREWATARAAPLHRTAFLLCGDWHVAEDLVQESLARTALHWRRVEAADSPDAYVRKILVNQARSRWRRRSNHERPSDELPDARVEDGSEDRARRNELLAALRSLPARQRATVVLRYFDQLSEAETAYSLDCSVGTVKSQTSRALATLRKTLKSPELPCAPTT
jgi:RNA polymerase sigma-70 factor (sigma-E family)